MTDGKLNGSINAVATAGMHVAEHLERGQAAMPLGKMFQDIADEQEKAPFSFVLLGLTKDARSAALAWLSGRDFRVMTIKVPDEVGLVQIRLQDRGFALERSGGEREEFDRFDPFLDAISDADLVQAGDGQSWVDPLRLRIEAPSGLQGLRISMPENPEAIRRNPGALSRLIHDGSMLVIVGPETWELDIPTRETLANLSGGIGVVWPIVMDAERTGEDGWWRDPSLLPHVALGPTFIGESELPSLPAEMLEPNSELRQAIFNCHLGRRLESSVNMVVDRYETTLRQTTARKKRDSRKLSVQDTAGMDATFRLLLDKSRTRINDDIGGINAGLKEVNRKAGLTSGPMFKTTNEIVDNLSDTDLERTDTAKAIKLTLDSDFKSHLVRSARKAMRERLSEDFVIVRDGLGDIRRDVENRIETAGLGSFALPVTMPDDRDVWSSMKEMLAVDFRYSGELKKRGFMQRLGEGRRVMFVMLMSVSLIGGFAGMNIRDSKWIGFVLLAVFAGVVAYTYKSWNVQDEEEIGKELSKVRETVRSELNKVVSEIQREKLQKLAHVLDQIKKNLIERLEEIGREAKTQVSKRADQEKSAVRDNLQRTEQQLRDQQEFGKSVQQLRQQADDVQRLCDRALKDVLVRR